jgi:putative endopeptidase
LAGDSAADAQSESQAIMKLETLLAKGSKSEVDLRDPIANYHPLPLGDIQKLSPHFDWSAYLGGIGLPAPAMMDIGQPEFLQALDAQIVATPVSDWKAYFRWHLVHDNAPFISTPFVGENFAFFGRTLTGTPQERDRWKRVLGEIDENAGEALGQLYVAVAFPPESKAWMLKLVANIRQALHDRIEHLEWMDEPTRAAALAKLDMFGVKIGYPDKWIDYSTLVIDRGPYILNVLRANDFNMRRDLAKIGKPVDRGLWGMTPPTVNAYYNPSMNEIVFPAGILQPPFYDKNADAAVNYGGIGAVIGHEMTHGFDDQGRQYDGKGNLADWWTEESKKRFAERSSGIVRQFSGYVAIDDLHVNGELTQGENIADLGGVKLSYAALMKTLAGKPEVKIDGFTPEQRFFLSFASIWRDNQRPEALKLQVNTDPHSPARLRVNGPLSNLDEFAAAFGVPDGAPMRRAAADRVIIW